MRCHCFQLSVRSILATVKSRAKLLTSNPQRTSSGARQATILFPSLQSLFFWRHAFFLAAGRWLVYSGVVWRQRSAFSDVAQRLRRGKPLDHEPSHLQQVRLPTHYLKKSCHVMLTLTPSNVLTYYSNMLECEAPKHFEKVVTDGDGTLDPQSKSLTMIVPLNCCTD